MVIYPDDDDKTQTFIALTSGTLVGHYRFIEKMVAGGRVRCSIGNLEWTRHIPAGLNQRQDVTEIGNYGNNCQAEDCSCRSLTGQEIISKLGMVLLS